MPPDDRQERPLLNPVLTLRKAPAPETARGGGPSAKHIVESRLPAQRLALAQRLDAITVSASEQAQHDQWGVADKTGSSGRPYAGRLMHAAGPSAARVDSSSTH